MKIALVFDDSLARPDGVQEYVRNLARTLGERGHEVHVWCSGEAGQPPAGVASVRSLTGNVGVVFNGNGLRTPKPASRRALRVLLAAERPDVIHVQSPHSPLFAARVVREARRVLGGSVRIIGTFHILPDGAVSEWGTRLLGAMLRRNLALFDAITAVSRPAAGFAARAFRVTASVTGIPVDVVEMRRAAAERPWGEPPAPRVIAFLGRLVPRKGVLELIDAVAALPPAAREGLDVRIGGRGPLAAQAAALAERCGLADTVRFLGFIADEDKAGFLAAADIAVFPATGGESFGIVLAEAMAAGAGVVLAGDNPGYASTVDDPRVLVTPQDSAAFARRLAAFLTDQDLRDAVHESQRARVEDFERGAVAASIEALYSGDE